MIKRSKPSTYAPPILTNAQAAFWQEFRHHMGYAHDKHVTPFDCDMFGGADIADTLLDLVLIGRKRATCALVRSYMIFVGRLPKIGDLSIITDVKGNPACVIETTGMQIAPLNQVTPHFAWREGEGMRMVSDWLAMHQHYFTREARSIGQVFTPDMQAVFEEFDVVWQPKHDRK